MAIVLKKISKLPFAPVVAGLFALVAAGLVMATPIWLLEDAVTRIGVDSVIAAAAPPLGMKAHALLGIAAALGTGAVFWVALLPVARFLDRKKPKVVRAAAPAVPNARDDIGVGLSEEPVSAGRRRPILAEQELGAPFMSDEALSDAPIYPPLVVEPPVAPDELILDEVVAETGLPNVQETNAALPELNLEAEKKPEFQPEPVQQIAAQVSVKFETEKPNKAFALPVPPPAAHEQMESIADLVQRLEHGLSHRADAIAAAQDAAAVVQQPAAAEPQSAPSAAVMPAPGQAEVKDMDSALRQALSTLERLAVGAR